MFFEHRVAYHITLPVINKTWLAERLKTFFSEVVTPCLQNKMLQLHPTKSEPLELQNNMLSTCCEENAQERIEWRSRPELSLQQAPLQNRAEIGWDRWGWFQQAFYKNLVSNYVAMFPYHISVEYIINIIFYVPRVHFPVFLQRVHSRYSSKYNFFH